MKSTKPKTALSKAFSRLNTTFRRVQNLTRSQRATVGQYCLLVVAAALCTCAMVYQHLPSLALALVVVVGAFYLEGYRD